MRYRMTIILAVSFIFLRSTAVLGQPPNLGAASGFALFTKTGAFDNLGTSNVTGDIGSNSYSLTGFPPGTVIGQIHAPPDAVTAQAATDVDNAYAYMSTLGGAPIGVLLGGQTLIPGVYNTGAASTLNGNITLDAQGVPTAVFIIRVGGALSVSASSNVILTNSASLCNVYWQVGGQFYLATGAVFRGTLLIDGAIDLASGSTLLGRALSKAGAITMDNTIVNNSMAGKAGSVTGPSIVCPGQTGVVYSVAAIVNATDYIWTLPAGVTITAGNNTNSITVSFSLGATTGNVSVKGSNSCSTGTASPDYSITVNPLPVTTLIYHF